MTSLDELEALAKEANHTMTLRKETTLELIARIRSLEADVDRITVSCAEAKNTRDALDGQLMQMGGVLLATRNERDSCKDRIRSLEARCEGLREGLKQIGRFPGSAGRQKLVLDILTTDARYADDAAMKNNCGCKVEISGVAGSVVCPHGNLWK